VPTVCKLVTLAISLPRRMRSSDQKHDVTDAQLQLSWKEHLNQSALFFGDSFLREILDNIRAANADMLVRREFMTEQGDTFETRMGKDSASGLRLRGPGSDSCENLKLELELAGKSAMVPWHYREQFKIPHINVYSYMYGTQRWSYIFVDNFYPMQGFDRISTLATCLSRFSTDKVFFMVPHPSPVLWKEEHNVISTACECRAQAKQQSFNSESRAMKKKLDATQPTAMPKAVWFVAFALIMGGLYLYHAFTTQGKA
jgi:hypothetical protein